MRGKTKLLTVLASLCLVAVGFGTAKIKTADAEVQNDEYLRLTQTYNTQSNYAGGSIYASRAGVGVRTIGNIKAVSGAYFLGTVFNVDTPKTITVDTQAVVFDVSVIGANGSYSFRLGTDKLYGKGVTLYLYSGTTFVRTVTSKTDASYGLVELPSDGTYDKVVIPVTSLGITSGTEYALQKISVLARQGYQTANTAKYVMHGAYLLESYTANGEITLTEENKIYTPSVTNFSVYGQNTTKYTPSDYIDARYMKKGDLLFDDAINCGATATEEYPHGTPATEKLYFRIGETSTVKLLQEYDGFYYTLTNTDTETDYNFLWELTAGSTSYWSNVQTSATVVYKGGTEKTVTPRYMHKNTENAIYYVPFTAFGNLASVDETTDFDNTLLLQIYASNASNNANPKLNENGGIMLNLGDVTFVKDGTVFTATADLGENANGTVKFDRAKYMDGMTATITAKANDGYKLSTFTVNGVDKKAELISDKYVLEVNGALNVSATFAPEITEEKFYYAGASIRLNKLDEGGAIRFGFLLEKELKDYYDTLGASYKAVLLPERLLADGAHLTEDTALASVVDLGENFVLTTVDGKEYCQANVTLYGIGADYYSDGILARAFIQTATETFYTSEKTARSFTGVAQACYNDPETTETTKSLLTPFLPKLVFSAGEGTGTMQDVVLTDTCEYVFETCTFTAPKGKNFAGYQVGTEVYAVGDTVRVSGTLTVTALWE